MLHGERDLQSEIQLMISGGRIWLLTGCMIPKSAQPSSEECALFSASQSEPTQHEHMAETTTTEPGGITPAQARAV